MAVLKLTKLPDRKPVRLTIKLEPALHDALRRYAALYRETYGEKESVEALIPFMLQSFLNDDRAFTKAARKKGRHDDEAAAGTGSCRVRGHRGISETSVSEKGDH